MVTPTSEQLRKWEEEDKRKNQAYFKLREEAVDTAECYYSGQSVSEIAKKFGITAATVRVRFRRAESIFSQTLGLPWFYTQKMFRLRAHGKSSKAREIYTYDNRDRFSKSYGTTSSTTHFYSNFGASLEAVLGLYQWSIARAQVESAQDEVADWDGDPLLEIREWLGHRANDAT